MTKHLIKENAYMALLDRTYKPTERDYVKYAMDTPDGRKQFDKDVQKLRELIKACEELEVNNRNFTNSIHFENQINESRYYK